MSDNVTPSQDTYLSSKAPTTNYSTATTAWVGRQLGFPPDYNNALLNFDLTAYRGQIVSAAMLYLYVSTAAGAASAGVLQRVTPVAEGFWTGLLWVAGEVTWNKRSADVNWTLGGGDVSETDEVEFSYPTDVGWITFDVQALAQWAVQLANDYQGDTHYLPLRLARDAHTLTQNWEFVTADSSATDYHPYLTITANDRGPFRVEAAQTFSAGADAAEAFAAGAAAGQAFGAGAVAAEVAE